MSDTCIHVTAFGPGRDSMSEGGGPSSEHQLLSWL
jgi:hypothetical protein